MSKKISIWYRPEDGDAEVVDTANGERQAATLLNQYQQAFGVLPGQHRHGRDKVWAGRLKDEPAS